MSISTSAYSAYDSSEDRDEKIIAVKIAEKISLSAASKIVSAIAKERGESGTTRGLTDSIMAYLVEADRSEDEFHKWIKDNGTTNTARFEKSVWQKVRKATNDIRANHVKELEAIANPGPMPEKPKAATKSRRSNKVAA